MAHAELHRCLEIAELRAAVEAPPGEPHRELAFFAKQRRDCIGELDLAARARRDGGEQLEDARREYVASDDREVGGRACRLGFLDDAVDTRAVILHALDRD